MSIHLQPLKKARDLRAMGLDVADFIPDSALVKDYSEHRESRKSRRSVRAWCVWVKDGKALGSLVEGTTP